jgi:hypothetical protein
MSQAAHNKNNHFFKNLNRCRHLARQEAASRRPGGEARSGAVQLSAYCQSQQFAQD